MVEVVAAWFRVIGWAQAGMARAAAELHRRVRPYESPAGVTHRVVRGRRSAGRTGAAAHEIAMRLGLTRQAAQAVIDDGLAFDEALAPVGDRLASGDIDLARARAFVDALGDSPAPTAVDVQDAVLPRAPRRTAPEVRRDIAAALIAVDPAEATVRHANAREGRRVNHPAVLPDGMAALYAVMPAVDLAALDIALDAAARTAKAGGDPRTIDQLRADALATVGHGALATGWIGRPPTRVVVPLEPVPAEPAPAERVPADALPAGLVSTEPVPAEPVPAEPVPAEPAPTERVPADAVPAGLIAAELVPAEPVPAEPAPAEGVLVDAVPAGLIAAELVPAESVPADATPAEPVPDDALPAGPAVRTGSQCFRIGSIGGRPARINVTVPLGVLMGADQDVEEAARRRWDPDAADPLADVPVREVAMLEGYGPVTPDVARALAMGGVWQRLVTDPTSGTVLDVGRTRYTPPPEMADLVRARDRYCVRPGCGTRAQGCDLDHTTPFHTGGRTAVDNLGSLCASDHALKSDGAYRVEQPEAGVFVFHLPSGHSYRRERDGSTTMLGRCSPPAAGPGVAEPGRPVGAPRLPGGDQVRAADGTPCTDADDLGPPPF